ncbi:hypothetical protein ACFWWS_37100 [Streptomyces sp. NPDC059083]
MDHDDRVLVETGTDSGQHEAVVGDVDPMGVEAAGYGDRYRVGRRRSQ